MLSIVTKNVWINVFFPTYNWGGREGSQNGTHLEFGAKENHGVLTMFCIDFFNNELNNYRVNLVAVTMHIIYILTAGALVIRRVHNLIDAAIRYRCLLFQAGHLIRSIWTWCLGIDVGTVPPTAGAKSCFAITSRTVHWLAVTGNPISDHVTDIVMPVVPLFKSTCSDARLYVCVCVCFVCFFGFFFSQQNKKW